MLKIPRRESMINKPNLNEELRRSSSLSMQHFQSNPSMPLGAICELNVNEASNLLEDISKSDKNGNVKFFKNQIV